MTLPVSALASTVDEQETTVRRVEGRLRAASARLGSDVSATDVRAAQQAIGDAEQALGHLVHDPWEPSVVPLRRAREILSSHLLAASVCEGADVAPPVTARVLRRGADSARQVLARHGRPLGSDDPEV